MNNISMKESETISAIHSIQTIESNSDHQFIDDISVKKPNLEWRYCANGCVPKEDNVLASNVLNKNKNSVNGFSHCISNNTNGNNGSIGGNVFHANNVGSGDNTSSLHMSQTSQTCQTSPFPRLSGETQLYDGLTSEGIIIVTNFRLFLSYNAKERGLPISPISLPLCIIESIELRDIYYLYIYTKHVRSFIFSFASGDDCSLWLKRLTDICALESKLENLYCFKFSIATKSDNKSTNVLIESKRFRNCYETLYKEFKRMGFESNVLNNTIWRISDINKEFKLCTSYPQYLIVPQNVNDKDLESVANFRYSRRIPTVVWRDRRNGCVIARSSQPEVGWLGWRNSQDEHLLQSIIMSCITDETKNKKLLVLDARSYTAAVANRAKGGGCECPEYYLSSEVQFMSLANIHSIRKSFHSLRYICESPADQLNWLTLLDNSKWLHNISALMKSALIVVNAIDIEQRPVLVHCSDGWDRTPQIVALAELMLDPYYRTIDGFKVLIEREWIQFGHKFADRCGHGSSSDDTNERCPVFLQWIDCVHQLVRQFPISFEFNLNFLIKLIQHTYSCLFGTFICNNMQQRLEHLIDEKTFSVWTYFNSRRQQFVNYVYLQNEQILRPSCKAKDIVFWSDVYMPLSTSVCGTFLPNCCAEPPINTEHMKHVNPNPEMSRNGIFKDSNIDLKQNESEMNVSNNENNETESDMDTIASDKHHSLSKTRSCENIALDDHYNHCSEENSMLRTRHCSDPNLLRKLSIADQIEWEKGKCEDILKYIRDLQTNEVVASRDTSDRDSNQVPLSRDSENGSIEETDVGLSAHFSMLSTETLLNGNNSYIDNIGSCCETHNSLLTNLLTTSTSTTELSNSCVQNNDLTVQFDKLYHSVYCHKKKPSHTSSAPIQRQSSNDNNTCNGNGKHTRTPSSGCPATPNDEQCFDVLPSDSQTLNREVFDIDGQVLLRDKILVRLQQIMGQNKNEIEYLRKELYLARLALCQQLKYCNPTADENSTTNPIHSSDYFAENTSLDSWIELMPSLQANTNGFTINGKCDENNSSNPFDSEVNNSADEYSFDSNELSLKHL